ncbi:MAG: polyhydroxyalkanoate synthesis repressor PhaR [Candidatus Competibacteraceae bacterium]|nr:polyhydroxyalkanoate synthesis repressor PhaR [Candidatus Competibacteraceae bacterium]
MSEPRIIKKYPNRRLYDTAVSSYITLENVKQLVLERTDFNVIDARTNTDITRGILLQIISEQEEQGNPIFTTEVLAHIIRFYGDTLQGMMGNYLEKSLQVFVDQQHLFREQMRSLIGKNPLAMMTELVEHNLSLWKASTIAYNSTRHQGCLPAIQRLFSSNLLPPPTRIPPPSRENPSGNARTKKPRAS